jgi:hypothetical protein
VVGRLLVNKAFCKRKVYQSRPNAQDCSYRLSTGLDRSDSTANSDSSTVPGPPQVQTGLSATQQESYQTTSRSKSTSLAKAAAGDRYLTMWVNRAWCADLMPVTRAVVPSLSLADWDNPQPCSLSGVQMMRAAAPSLADLDPPLPCSLPSLGAVRVTSAAVLSLRLVAKPLAATVSVKLLA